MASNDPTKTGGLFIGRRPGTAPLRYRKRPERPAGAGAGSTRSSPAAILVLETLICTTLWGPQPAGWLWIGSQVFHETDSIGLGILVAFAGMLATILGTLGDRDAPRPRLEDRAPRRAATSRRTGMLERIFVISMAIAGIAFADLVPGHPGPRLRHRAAVAAADRGPARLLPQFDDMGESEYNKALRERRAREKALALEHVPTLDLSGTEWPELPSAEVVSASVYQARGRLNGYPDPDATQVRRALAERHYIRGAQIVLGNGAAELLRSALYLLAGRRRGRRPRPT